MQTRVAMRGHRELDQPGIEAVDAPKRRCRAVRDRAVGSGCECRSEKPLLVGLGERRRAEDVAVDLLPLPGLHSSSRSARGLAHLRDVREPELGRERLVGLDHRRSLTRGWDTNESDDAVSRSTPDLAQFATETRRGVRGGGRR